MLADIRSGASRAQKLAEAMGGRKKMPSEVLSAVLRDISIEARCAAQMADVMLQEAEARKADRQSK